jgi:uncharacterized protein YhhL (DUF1145 family)
MHQLIELSNEQVKDLELVNPNQSIKYSKFVKNKILLLLHDIQLLLLYKNIEEKSDLKEEI